MPWLDEVLDEDALAAALDSSHHRNLSDAGNAEVFCDLFQDLVRYDHARRRWLVWDSHRWRPDEDSTVYRMALHAMRMRFASVRNADDMATERREKIAKHALASEARSKLDSLLALARTMQPIADDGRDWDTIPYLLGVPNGVVDLRTGELRDGEPDDRITMQAGVEFDPEAVCPRWDDFLEEILWPEPEGDETVLDSFINSGARHDEARELVIYLQRLTGYSFTAENSLDILIFLMGGGGNGKTTLMDMLNLAAGDYARQVPASTLKATKFDRHLAEIADLELGRFASCEEIGNEKLNANRLKMLSGGSGTAARLMHENMRRIEQTWTIWVTTNGAPQTDDPSWAFWRRMRVFNFPNYFEEDPNLSVVLGAELPGILAWVVRGAAAFYHAGGREGVRPAAVEDAVAEYRGSTDPLQELFDSGVFVMDADASTPTEELHKAYRQAMSAAGNPAAPKIEFGRLLSQRGLTKARIGASGSKGFRGIRPAESGADG